MSSKFQERYNNVINCIVGPDATVSKRNTAILLSIVSLIGIIMFILFLFGSLKLRFTNILNEKVNFSDVYEVPTTGKETFSPTLVTPDSELNEEQPMRFDNNFVRPPINEEIGFGMIYPQGSGVSMSPKDSDSFSKAGNYILLSDHTIPESYGESSFNDPTGKKSARIIEVGSVGKQNQFKPYELNFNHEKVYSEAYKNGNTEFVKSINYNDPSFVPEENTVLQGSPGKTDNSSNVGCDTLYPKVVKYKGSCITAGDIPYGTTIDVNGKKVVNPRLVSAWESYTNKYNADDVINGTSDGLLYPKI